MVTEHDKAIVALIMALIQIANVYGVNIGVDEHTVTQIVTVLTPILIWLTPNKKTTPP